MPTRISFSQLKSRLQQAENRRRQEIDRVNQQIRTYNQNLNRAVENYNREARAYNAQVAANRRRIFSELARLQNQLSNPRYITFKISVNVLHTSYVQLEDHFQYHHLNAYEGELLNLSQKETANSVEVANLLDASTNVSSDTWTLENNLGNELIVISPDLDSRWKGALYALNPRNPDAARHFCASTREIFTQALDMGAQDSEVIRTFPACNKTDDGKPTRRAKIDYCLHQKRVGAEVMAKFVDADVENILELFKLLNTGTHGSAGIFDVVKLRSIKKRVEDGIRFLSKIVR